MQPPTPSGLAASDAPTPEPDQVSTPRRHRGLGWRIAGVLVGLLWLFGSWVVTGFLSVASEVGGWLPAALAYAPGVLLVAVWVKPRRWPVGLVVGSAVSLALGVWSYQIAPPSFERLEVEATDVGVPDGWEPVRDEISGSTWGLWGAFPERRYIYSVPGDSRVVADAFTARLEVDGWDYDEEYADTSREERWTYQVWRKGQRTVTLNINTPDGDAYFEPGIDPDDNQVAISFE
jgi:hypothetical protein